MNEHLHPVREKSLVYRLAEAYERHRVERRAALEQSAQPRAPSNLRRLLHWLTPNGGTLLLIAALLLTQNAWARTEQRAASAPGPSATTVNYQGRLADSGGAPLDGSYGMSFALYDALTGGSMVWGPESHTAVPVSEGLFSVGLGSLTGGGIPTSVWDGDRYLEIIVGGETLSPRELIRSVPVAGMALTVPDGAITVEKLGLPYASHRSHDDFSTTSEDFVSIPNTEVTITLDAAAKLLIIFAGDIKVNTQGAIVEVAVAVDGETYTSGKVEFVNAPANTRVTGSQSMIINVDAGTHTLELRLRSWNGAIATIGHKTLTVLAFN